jgi:DNA adenine methylase/adenine-specific DNA-methyltransferase
VKAFPQLRYMGSKYRLLEWIHEVFSGLQFDTALDAFSGSGCVAYLLKRMGKQVTTNDFLLFPYLIGAATIANQRQRLTPTDLELLLHPNRRHKQFIEKNFQGVYFDLEGLRFLDQLWANLGELKNPRKRALALTAAFRACVKKQPRGVFTVTGNLQHYDDGRRDLRLSLRELFLESVQAYNEVIFDNGRRNQALRGDVGQVPASGLDLVYMDPPYVPRADDNCYIKRYHFLEGLASYWSEPGTEILTGTTSRKIAKRHTPFSYRRTAVDAFRAMFRHFAGSTLVLSYSSNGYPDLDTLMELMREVKPRVTVHERPHRYHFGTHAKVSEARASVREYLIVGE